MEVMEVLLVRLVEQEWCKEESIQIDFLKKKIKNTKMPIYI